MNNSESVRKSAPHGAFARAGTTCVEEERFQMKIMDGKKMRSLHWHVPLRRLLALAAGLGGFPAMSFAASLVLASTSTLTLAGAQQVTTLHLNAAQGAALQQIAQGKPASLPGNPASYRSAALVLDNVTLTAAGAQGGYFYTITLARAGQPRAAGQQPVGTLGPFEIAAARKRGASLAYSLDGMLDGDGDLRASPLLVTFQQAGNADGPLIGIGSLRLELRTEAGLQEPAR